MKKTVLIMGIFALFASCSNSNEQQNKEWQQQIEQEGEKFKEQKDKALRESSVHEGLIESIKTSD